VTLVVAQPSGNLTFVTQPPANVNPGQTFPVALRLMDNSGAVIPGASISLGLLSNPTGTTLQPANPTSLTNADGQAVFNIGVPAAGLYNLIATANAAGITGPIVAASNMFNVVDTFTVINTAGTGTGSLRQAILDANAAPGMQKIRFNIPGAAPFTIVPQTPLPAIVDGVDLDATSQPGWSGTPVVIIDGSVVSAGTADAAINGLWLEADNSSIRGLSIRGFTLGAGLYIGSSKAFDNVIRDNLFIGNGTGVWIDNFANHNAIGSEAGGNTIQNNVGAGVAVTAGASNNPIRRNQIDGNGRPGIDLGSDGVTANDTGDADTGPNALQNWPAMDAATFSNGYLFMVGNLNSVASTPFSIDYYYTTSCDNTAPRGAQRHFAFMPVTDASGNASVTLGFAVTMPLTAGYYTASATRSQNATGWDNNVFFETSELSNCVPVAVGGTGGSAFAPIMCPGFNVATGFQGRSGDDIDRIELWCSTVDGPAVGPSTFVGGIGNTDAGAAYNMSCPSGTVMTGIFGKAGTATFGGDVVDSLGITCTDVVSNATTNVGPTGIESPGSTPFSMICPAGQRVAGIQGRLGALLDQLAIVCK
jgi:hypothetical protein